VIDGTDHLDTYTHDRSTYLRVLFSFIDDQVAACTAHRPAGATAASDRPVVTASVMSAARERRAHRTSWTTCSCEGATPAASLSASMPARFLEAARVR
jgi:hypothetical protein